MENKWVDCLEDISKAWQFEVDRRILISAKKFRQTNNSCIPHSTHKPSFYDIPDDFFDEIIDMHHFPNLESFKSLVCQKITDDLSNKIIKEKENKHIPYNWIMLHFLPKLRKINPCLFDPQKFKTVMHLSHLFDVFVASSDNCLSHFQNNLVDLLLHFPLGVLAVYFVKHKDPN